MLQECTASNTPKAGVLSILQYLRETVRTDALVAVELAELSAVKHVIKTLGFKTLDPKVPTLHQQHCTDSDNIAGLMYSVQNFY